MGGILKQFGLLFRAFQDVLVPHRTLPWVEHFNINMWKFGARNPVVGVVVVVESLEDEMDLSECNPALKVSALPTH
ncbi:hypothetical protein E2C01_040485 [Portunus trituberculatus]|uniref:Uncharacterized protein n=1 Tax=Portunus trituberculatus TaxID=210409 RepID=A0A5B7FNE9_PORTR|nr:hypothetical protein [Portunus trituberculatus]